MGNLCRQLKRLFRRDSEIYTVINVRRVLGNNHVIALNYKQEQIQLSTNAAIKPGDLVRYRGDNNYEWSPKELYR
jgi:hypothetical protein